MNWAGLVFVFHFGLGACSSLVLAPHQADYGYIRACAVGAFVAVVTEATWHRLGFSPSKVEIAKHMACVGMGGAAGGLLYEFIRPPSHDIVLQPIVFSR